MLLQQLSIMNKDMSLNNKYMKYSLNRIQRNVHRRIVLCENNTWLS